MKKLVVLILILAIAPAARALTVNLSLDGVNPAPETIDVIPGQVLPMYVISDSDGVDYWKWVHTMTPAIIENVRSYPAAGDLANIADLSYIWEYNPDVTCYEFELEAADSGGNIEAGKHFGFDLTISMDATPGTWEYLHLDSTPIPDDTVILNIVPEPGTVLLFGFGGLALLRRGFHLR